MKLNIHALFVFICLICCIPCTAQFYSSGSDDGSLRWRSINAGAWKIIYPENCDSLARAYAVSLCKWSREGFPRKIMPVILHTQNAYSNGMVIWAPRRMELYTTPDSQPLESGPWTDLLTVHESRHVRQMQAGGARPYRVLNFLSGELWTGAVSALYGGPAFLEGDAVTAETALTSSGRGRSAEFLEYWKACNLDGKQRSWWQWRYGSQKLYTPDHYRTGYVLVAGTRTVFDDPDFTERFYSRIEKKGFPLFNMQKTVREASGKTFRESMRIIDSSLTAGWAKDTLSKYPYTETKLISQEGNHYVSYSGLCDLPTGLYALKQGIADAATLIKFEHDGDSFSEEKTICDFSSSCGAMNYSAPADRVFWSEIVPDLRWEQKSCSEIRYLDEKGRKRTLVGGRRLFNPATCDSQPQIAVVEYLENGESSVLVLDALDGSEIFSWKVPAGLQVCELAWNGEQLYGTVLSEGGFSIRSIPDFRTVLPEKHVNVRSLSSSHTGALTFTSDLSGSNECYSLNPENGEVRQLTSSRVGAHDGILTHLGLVFCSTGSNGTGIRLARTEDLRSTPVDWNEGYSWAWAEKLSEQEKARSKGQERNFTPEISEPIPYKKGKNLVNVHSWLPVFVNADDIASASLETLQQNAWLGATAFFQNELGTFYGSAGVRLLQNLMPGNQPFAGGMAKICWRGKYPVLEADIDVGNGFTRRSWIVDDGNSLKVRYKGSDKPLVSSTLRAYVPLRFSSGGWSRGLVTSLSWNFSNELEGSTIVTGEPVMTSFTPGTSHFRNGATASARWYSMRPIPSSCIYPRLGIGVEAGMRFYPGLGELHKPVSYLYAYGYLPGLSKVQGLRLSASLQHQSPESLMKDRVLAIAPRGFYEAGGLMNTAAFSGKFSADYAIPFASLDWDGLCPLVYIRNLEATLHADYAYLFGTGTFEGHFGAGADLALHLSNLAWIPYDTRIGVSWNWNSGLSRHIFGLVFSVDL